MTCDDDDVEYATSSIRNRGEMLLGEFEELLMDPERDLVLRDLEAIEKAHRQHLDPKFTPHIP